MIDPSKKYLYFNPDSTSGEMDSSASYPVSQLSGIEITTSGLAKFYFKGSKGVDATVVTVAHEQHAFQKSFMVALSDEINFGEKAFIKVMDAAESLVNPSDVTYNINASIAPIFDDQADTLTIQNPEPVTDPWNSTTIKVLPNQFIVNDDSGRPAMIEDDGTDELGVRAFGTTEELYAFVKIPDGWKATHVQVHASASTSSAVSVNPYNYQTGDTSAVSVSNGDFNANIDITDIPASATQDVVIGVQPASSSTVIYGATVTIATV